MCIRSSPIPASEFRLCEDTLLNLMSGGAVAISFDALPYRTGRAVLAFRRRRCCVQSLCLTFGPRVAHLLSFVLFHSFFFCIWPCVLPPQELIFVSESYFFVLKVGPIYRAIHLQTMQLYRRRSFSHFPSLLDPPSRALTVWRLHAAIH